MGLFVNVIIDQSKFSSKQDMEKLVNICPVDIFVEKNDQLIINPENVDECTFCYLCLNNFPEGGILIEKRYQYWIENPNY